MGLGLPQLPRGAPCQRAVKHGERTVVRSGLDFDVGAEHLQGRAAAGDQAAGPAPEHRGAEMPPQLVAMGTDETVLRLFTKTEGFTTGSTAAAGGRGPGSLLNSPRSQPQHSRRRPK